MPSQWTIKASSRDVVVGGDGVVDAFYGRCRIEKTAARFGKKIRKNKSFAANRRLYFSLSYRLI